MREQELAPVKKVVTRRVRDYRFWFILGIFVVVLTYISIYALVGIYYVRAVTVTISDLKAVDPINVCPGERLNYRYNLHINGEGEVDIYATIFRVISPRDKLDITVPTYTTIHKFITEEEIDIMQEREIFIPMSYEDQNTGKSTSWASGDYIYRLEARMARSRTGYSRLSFPFSIREGCIS